VLEGVLSQTLLPRATGGGRIAAFEIMLGTYAIRNLIRESRTHEIPTVLEMSSSRGMQTLDQALEDLFDAGLVSFDEALSRAHKPEALRNKLDNSTTDTRKLNRRQTHTPLSEKEYRKASTYPSNRQRS